MAERFNSFADLGKAQGVKPPAPAREARPAGPSTSKTPMPTFSPPILTM
jgi:hypothetical protein